MEVGVILGVLPLFISAIEHYDDCLKPLQRFVCFSTELRRFLNDLAIEKQKFTNECSIILLSALDWKQSTSSSDNGDGPKAQTLAVVDSMLRNRDNPQWSNKSLGRRVQEQLGSSAKLITALINEIASILSGLKADSLAFESAIEHAGGPGISLLIRARWKASFSHGHLDKLKRLEWANNKFRELHEQSVQIMKSVRRDDRLKSVPDPSALERYRRIQRASREVYQTLARSCCEHSEHLTRMCLEVKSDESRGRGPDVFRLAFGKHAFFFVKTASDIDVGSEQIANEVEELFSCTEKQILDQEQPAAQDADGTVLHSLVPNPVPESHSGDTSEVYTLSSLCAQIGPCSQITTGSAEYSSILHSPEPLAARDLVLTDIPFPSASTTSPGRSLHDLLTDLPAQGRIGRLSRSTQIHLARLLTTAVLQYYRTPWLRAWWRSTDILFVDTDAAALAGHDPAKARLAAPHIAVPVRDLLVAPPSRASTFPLQDVARNPVLYGLGILLIELAYSSPISTLTMPDDSKQGPAFVEWLAARRLERIVHEEMGPAYARIVRHCLYCDFGCAEDDLSNAELQAAYYNTVVHELETIDAEMQALYA
jgi:hypothetical protein